MVYGARSTDIRCSDQAGGSSTLTMATASSTPVGNYSITVMGTGASASHATTISLAVNAPVSDDFSISANPSTLSVIEGQWATSTISTAVVSGSAQTVTLSAGGLPAGATARFEPTTAAPQAQSTLA